jgi:phospholipid/cholesterol/gamma-HCH transport system substrate-binding protein
MKRSTIVKWGNLWVGILVSIAIAALLYSSFRGGGTSVFEPKDNLVTYLRNVNGLVPGAPVWLGGVEVGNVKSVKFVNLDERRRIRVEVTIKKSVWEFVTEGTTIQLGTIGVLGDKYVEVIPGPKENPILESGTEVPPAEESGLASTLERAPAITASLDTILTNLKDVTKALSSPDNTAGRLISDTILYARMVTALEQTSKVLKTLNANQQKILDDLGRTLDNAASLTSKMDNGDGSLAQMVNDKQLYTNLLNSSAQLDTILEKLDRGEGFAAALINDAQLGEDIRILITRVNNLVADIEKNPRKYFKFSIF